MGGKMHQSSEATSCSVAGCGRPIYVKKAQLCNYHYTVQRQTKTCSVEGCANRVMARGLCQAHSRQQRNAVPTILCSVEGCVAEVNSRGLCSNHYQRHRRQLVWDEIIKLKGGCCQRCKGVFPYVVYDLHHRDPSIKTGMRRHRETFIENMSPEVRAELDSCDLLCANCHRIVTFQIEELELEGRVEL